MRALAELGADLNTPDDNGATPAYIAAHNGHVASIGALAEVGLTSTHLMMMGSLLHMLRRERV